MSQCQQNRVALHLYNTRYVIVPGESDALKCSGFFTESGNLSVGIDRPLQEWFCVLLHEYCHMLQWIEDEKYSTSVGQKLELLDKWLDFHIELSMNETLSCAYEGLCTEHDCEKRTVEIIRANPELEIDSLEYIQNANAYLYMYPLIPKYRSWCSIKAPYEVPELVNLMPHIFLEPIDRYLSVPGKVERLIIEQCFSKSFCPEAYDEARYVYY